MTTPFSCITVRGWSGRARVKFRLGGAVFHFTFNDVHILPLHRPGLRRIDSNSNRILLNRIRMVITALLSTGADWLWLTLFLSVYRYYNCDFIVRKSLPVNGYIRHNVSIRAFRSVRRVVDDVNGWLKRWKVYTVLCLCSVVCRRLWTNISQ